MHLCVIRGLGDKPGEDIIDGLISTDAVALARGASELDTHATIMQGVDIDIVFRTGVQLGMVAEVHDLLNGDIWIGKIVGISHASNGGDNPSLVSSLTLNRPTEFYD